ncbi:hypothetical protein TGPRC2_264850 [Toxoplasma gondii TgCatPRC2]|uniref:Uncharacterized protein n=4 Tax=Toxoplasma gondii TaxID=5811 RepID=A0A151H675_TOXGO|nr:hypothetical protein TGME49_264850 [Toxoplasma gondii ME49]EPT27777.1 hypothetical protein TGME49_264850 [Toxoplasma gondii ME49]KYF45361.1 hypothetical protein TGARI_264850 [Toxoplasma gondii ARI]KYK64783.1 hypothetical protein TGPRC2_264850 [Toxoplasma gondii TgCatPRC2]PIM01885.1 hypothetical protein TGCOUG_264850 [Toxoplasma gondii COUG]|eukprot:XP_002368614.1 hypothetical protein TGME49_264850 [Toxoplasma gondii ME49]
MRKDRRRREAGKTERQETNCSEGEQEFKKEGSAEGRRSTHKAGERRAPRVRGDDRERGPPQSRGKSRGASGRRNGRKEERRAGSRRSKARDKGRRKGSGQTSGREVAFDKKSRNSGRGKAMQTGGTKREKPAGYGQGENPTSKHEREEKLSGKADLRQEKKQSEKTLELLDRRETVESHQKGRRLSDPTATKRFPPRRKSSLSLFRLFLQDFLHPSDC